jgi:hypothetical protein
MDYTPVTFTDKKYPRVTTNAHELALDVVFESGIQHLADAASSYRALPDAARAYLKAVPAAWDETRLVSGDPGVRAVFARRSGRDWFVGGLNGRDAGQSYELDLSFLGEGEYALDLITDGAQPRTIAGATRRVRRADRVPVTMLPRGGFCGVLRPVR